MPDNRVPVIHTPEYTVFYERTDECIVVHCDIRKWTAQVKRHFHMRIGVAQALLGEPVYARWEGTELHRKFLKSVGFHPVGVATDLDTGKDVHMYCRSFIGKPTLLWRPLAGQ